MRTREQLEKEIDDFVSNKNSANDIQVWFDSFPSIEKRMVIKIILDKVQKVFAWWNSIPEDVKKNLT